MVRLSCALAATAAALTLAACGGSSADQQTLHAWNVPTPYLPPPSPDRLRAPSATTATTGTDPRADVAPGTRTGAPAAAPKPSTTSQADEGIAPGAPTDAEVAAELRQAFKGKAANGGSIVDQATLTTADLATVPPSAPSLVSRIINAGNQVARKPYVYGGGHGGGPEGLFVDSAYDCSGSISYALAAAGLIDSPMDSSSLARWGKPGPGKWVTIYANAGHAWMVVAGLRFDTSGRSTRGSRWQTASRSVAGFTVRHPPGL